MWFKPLLLLPRLWLLSFDDRTPVVLEIGDLCLCVSKVNLNVSEHFSRAVFELSESRRSNRSRRKVFELRELEKSKNTQKDFRVRSPSKKVNVTNVMVNVS